MEPINFIYWIQGYLELTNESKMNSDQIECIKEHIKLVLERVTPEKEKYDPGVKSDTKKYEIVRGVTSRRVIASCGKSPTKYC